MIVRRVAWPVWRASVSIVDSTGMTDESGRRETPFAEGRSFGVIWFILALVTWPVVALAAGLVLGRGIATCESRVPRLGPNNRSTRERSPDILAPIPPDREITPI
jgi:hypothetical protein